MAYPSDTVIILSYAFLSFELLTDIIVLGIACLNLVVLGLTTLLHSNLKCILIIQSVAVGLYVLDRSAMLLIKFISYDNVFAPANMTLQTFMTFDTIFKRMLGHALIIERFVATVRINSYENCQKFYFNLAWFSITFIIAFLNMITNGQSWAVTQFNLITSISSTVLSFVEFLMITIIGLYNRRKYNSQIEAAFANNYHIGQRYQVSENVKTAKQLLPAFFCIFLSNVTTNLMYIIISFNLVEEAYQKSLAFAFFIWLDAIISGAIELTVITHHPLLKKRFLLTRRLFFTVYDLFLFLAIASSDPPNSSESDKCSILSDATASDGIYLECHSQNALLQFTDEQQQRHRNVWSLRLDCGGGTDRGEGDQAQQDKVFEKLVNADQFRTLKKLSLLHCGPSSARFSRLAQLDELDFGTSEIARLDWQSIGSIHLRSLTIGRLSAVGGCKECRNGWLMERPKVFWPHPIFPRLPQNIITIASALPPNCTFSHCGKESARFEQKLVQSRLGSPLQLRCHFQTPNPMISSDSSVPNASSNNQNAIFVWPFSNYAEERRWEERPSIGGGSVELIVDALDSHHLGVVVCRCWHCNTPRFDVAEVRFWTPLSVSLNVDTYDEGGGGGVEETGTSTLLIVHGYPLERLRLGVRLLPNNLTEWHEFPAVGSTQQTFLNGSLLVRPESDHSQFFLRYFSLGIHDCSGCSHSQVGGTYALTVCRWPQNSEAGDEAAIPIAQCADTVSVQLTPTKHPTSNGASKMQTSAGFKWSSFVLLPSSVLLILVIIALSVSVVAVGSRARKTAITRNKKMMRCRKMSAYTQRTDETSIQLYAMSRYLSSTNDRHGLHVIDSECLLLKEPLGKGAFGEVYAALWIQKTDGIAANCEEDKGGESGTNLLPVAAAAAAEQPNGIGQGTARKVAMKFLTNLRINDEMQKEASLLAQLDHPNVLRMFGTSNWQGQIALVLELMNHGNLQRYLQSRAPRNSDYSPPPLISSELINISIQIAKGLCYLVQRKIVHRDLAARNCLVSGDCDLSCSSAASRPPICVKISDFGSSAALLPLRWTSPECLINGIYTHQSDIWSFGVLLFELFSYGDMPFGNLSNGEVSCALKNGKVPGVPEQCSPELDELMRRCWDQNAGDRISAEDALQRLKNIREQDRAQDALIFAQPELL
uniref:Protein kinase domain-containing protein n=1 Tax=Globodera rostochiensis TaxID=31243 RepID=A0A914H7V0_GLORO